MAGGYDAYFYGKGCSIQTSKFLSLEGIYYFVCGICYVEISFIVDPWFYNLLDVPMALGNKLEMDQMVHVVCNSAKLIVFFFTRRMVCWPPQRHLFEQPFYHWLLPAMPYVNNWGKCHPVCCWLSALLGFIPGLSFVCTAFLFVCCALVTICVYSH